MDPELQDLIRQLQAEKCPPTVLDRVAQRLAREKTPTRRLRVMWAVLIACLFSAVALWHGHTRRQAQLLVEERAVVRETANRAVVVEQTQEALGYIGHALIRAAAQTEDVLLREAVPPFRNSFETVKSKLIKPI
jgi:hypothetical protein